MGLRNPFRIEYNQETGELYIADYSPDANAPNPLRGPAGHGKWSIVTEAANFGWPYCATAKLPYGTTTSPRARRARRSTAPSRSTSRRTTRADQLPPVTQPDVWYTYRPSAEFPELETGGIGPMAGPAYQYDAKAAKGKNSTAWPEYYDNVPLFYEWTRDYIKAFFTGGGDVTRIETSLAHVRPRTTRSTSSSGRTGRCTSSITATASSARTCRGPSSCGSTTSAPRATARRRSR